MTDWLTDWLAGWLAGWLSGWLTVWLAGWLTFWLAGWLFGWLADCLAGWLTGWLAGWLADWLGGLQADWVTGWLFEKQENCLLRYRYVFIHAFLLHVLIPSAYTKCKDGQLSWNNVLFFFATGVLNCKISVTSEFIYENCNETMDILVDSSRNVYLPLWENTSRSWNQSYRRICRVPPADALREKSILDFFWSNFFKLMNKS